MKYSLNTLTSLLDKENLKGAQPTNTKHFSPDKTSFRTTLIGTHNVNPLAPTKKELNQQQDSNSHNQENQQYQQKTVNYGGTKKKGTRRPRRDTGHGEDALFEEQNLHFDNADQKTSVNRQSRVFELQSKNRQNRSSSEWALLDTLEVQMYNNERDQFKQSIEDNQHNTKEYLSSQMEVINRKKRAEEEQKVRDKQRIELAMEKYELENKEVEKKQREKNIKMKKERTEQIQEFREKKEAQNRRRILEDKEQLKAIQKALENEKQEKAQKQIEFQNQVIETQRDNQQRLDAKKLAQEIEKKEDQKLMEEYLKTLEKQEKERQDKLEAFQKTIAERSEKAGRMAVAEAAEKAEVEEQLLKKFEIDQENKIKQQLQAKKQAHDKLMQECDEQRKNQLEIKRKLKEDRNREDALTGAAYKALSEREILEDKEAIENERLKNMEHQKQVVRQIQEREERDVLDDIYMTRNERKLNAKLLHQAKAMVRAPHIVKLTHK
eukprot:TRINITY_DN11212_c0_g1_i3.p2 TRINITY_DN11212_c0_g1~~TRINITY_DN11212_c0_g1_i3.p2  ORF type:complete len:493 (-),score=106.33 TRINITY_DN11212_c0_g1_i3:109-1587(-)